MSQFDFAITFACYNQVEYTRLCVDSMIKHGLDLQRLVVVDNGSTDATREYLQTLPLGGRIYNKTNLGCGVAWNQGALALQAEWSIIMNNDVLVSRAWVENLLRVAEQNRLKVISPALLEGPLDYDFDAFADNAMAKTGNALRMGGRHAVCMAIHQSVWQEIGYFQSVPKLWGYEDTMFFHEMDKANIPSGITGAAWLHHFGSITQKAIKLERGLSDKEGLGNRHNYRLLHQGWLERKLSKAQRKKQSKAWRDAEMAQYGMTLHGLRNQGNVDWI